MISIHQPEHMPWLGFFDKMSKVREFVILDNVQYRKGYFQNRNRIISKEGSSRWLTVPVKKFSSQDEIRDINLLPDNKWKVEYLNLVKDSYINSKNFDIIFPELEKIIIMPHTTLISLNISLIRWIKSILQIDTKLLIASQVIKQKDNSDINLQIIRALGAKTYLSGPHGRDYLDYAVYKSNNIQISYHSFENPNYMRANDAENLCSLHYLFNHSSL